jgi:hypothetical protein
VSRFRVVVLILLGALALSSCTLVAPNARFHRIAIGKDPYGLFQQTIPGTNNARVVFKTQPVYMVDATNHLVASSRIVPSPPSLATVIEQLLLGPSVIEASAGYTSALPTGMVLISADVRNQIGYFNFAEPFTTLSPRQQLLAVGQLVLTAFDVGATKGVIIKVAGVQQELLMPDGTHAVLVNAKNYESLLN